MEWQDNMARFKNLDGVQIPYTPEEEAQADADAKIWADGAFDRGIVNLRAKRNLLLAETDWWASSDLVMSDERKVYRQTLRGLPAGLDTADKVKAVTWPEKPE